MSVKQYTNVAYGLTQALINEFPVPIVSVRNPTVNDRAQIGTLWVNSVANGTFIITSIVANQAIWVNAATGTDFTSLTVDPGDITVTNGDINVDLGSIAITAGDLTLGTGSITAAGSITAGTGLVATTGGLTVDAGGITVTAGNITVVAGGVTIQGDDVALELTGTDSGISATGEIFTTGDIASGSGNIIADSGNLVSGANLYAQTVIIEGDTGAVAMGDIGITNVTDTTQSTGHLTILSDSVNAGNNAGFIKIYVGATTAYIPYFTDIAP